MLYRLDPFLDWDRLVRVGGRLSKSEEFSEGFKHPVILAKKSFIMDLIIRDVPYWQGRPCWQGHYAERTKKSILDT